MFIPSGADNLKDSAGAPQIKLGLQGPSGSGKTYAALSFPNPIIADFDGNLSRFAGKDIPRLKFYSSEWLEAYHNGAFKAKKAFDVMAPNIHSSKDAFMHFIYNDARKLGAEQTLIVDSWSSIMDNVNNFYCTNPVLVKGEGGVYVEDTRKMYAEYKDYATIVFAGIKSLKCNIVMTFHEFQPRDKITGNLIENKIAPLMEGSYKDQIKKHFTEFFRCINQDGKYVLQVKSDAKFDAITRATIKAKEIFYDVTEPKKAYDFFVENFNLTGK